MAHLMPMTTRWLVLALWLGCAWVGSDADASNPEYYCLEHYKPIGDVLSQPALPADAWQSTSGHIARQCSAACSADPACTAFLAVGYFPPSEPDCQLLTNTSAALTAALQVPQQQTTAAGAVVSWPAVLQNDTTGGGLCLRSHGWLCFRGPELWDEFGTETHRVIHQEPAAAGASGSSSSRDDIIHTSWCAFGTDVAGTNLQQYTANVQRPVDCDELCRNSSGCTLWTFAAAQTGSGQEPYNCFVKTDAARGANGWTGRPKPDIWIPDSQVDCFENLMDWRQLGLILSPATKTITVNNTFFTLYPERVMFKEARQACSRLPGGQLAILDSRMEVDTVYRELLGTLSPETGVTSAWIGVMGNNTHYNPAAQNQTGLGTQHMTLGEIGQLQPQPVRNRTATGSETTLRWLNGEPVDAHQLRRLTQHDVWTVHDVIWNQQYVPDSSKDVCGRILVQTPPASSAAAAVAAPVDPAAVLPGIWYFDCDKLAAYICQSTADPNEPMAGRSIVQEATAAPADGGSSGNAPNWRLAVAVAVPLVVLLLAAAQLSRVYSRQLSRLPELVRQQRKRALGQPRYGTMSVVVTDIQGFTHLMRQAPDDMAQALLLHNQVMRHACYNNIGYVLEQEGDSYTLAFHEPQDAVAFTLQVQQALLDQPWPVAITYNDSWDNATSFSAAAATTKQQQLPAAAVTPRGTNKRLPLDYIISWIPGLSPTRSDSQPAAAAAVDDVDPSSTAAAAAGQRVSSEVQWFAESPLPHHHHHVTSITASENTAFSPSSIIGYGRRRAVWLQQLLNPGNSSRAAAAAAAAGGGGGLFHGLRVRMGVATGVVMRGQEVKNSSLYKRAQDVSNAAAGGEVLVDESTFLAVKEDLWRFGLVTAAGLDHNLLYTAAAGSSSSRSRGGGRALLPCLSDNSFPGSSRGSSRYEHALALDMGCFEVKHPAAAAAVGGSSGGSSKLQLVLWQDKVGNKLIEQHQHYLQQQLQQQDAQPLSEYDVITVRSDPSDIEQGYSTSHSGLPAPSASSVTCGIHGRPMMLPQGDQCKYLAHQRHQQHVGSSVWQQRLQQQHDQVPGVWRSLFGGLFGGRRSWTKNEDSSWGSSSEGVDSYNHPNSEYPAVVMMSYAGGSSNLAAAIAGGDHHDLIRVYQIIAPDLAGRAALFGSDLDTPKHWTMIDQPYFAAPGLSSSSSLVAAAEAMAAAVVRGSKSQQQQQQQQHTPAAALGRKISAGQTVQLNQQLVNRGSVRKLLSEQSDNGSNGPNAAAAAQAAVHADVDSSDPDLLRDQDSLHFTAAVAPVLPAAAEAAAAAARREDDLDPVADTSHHPDDMLDDFPFAPAPQGEAAVDIAPAGSTTTTPTYQQQQQHQKHLAAAAAAPLISNSAFLRGMSVGAEFTLPGTIRLGSNTVAAAGSSPSCVGVCRPHYSDVTVVFAMVEGAQQLLNCPTLARLTHSLIHHLMLRTLTLFPGSYLVRAQEGDMKYMAAFTSPAAAAEWCMTVQEASLYLPYPPQVLGLSSFGVQVDASGRLVLRGPRFKMGLSEGVPRCILPDHMGRADYHGPFVNQAARYADAAAHGGQVVTDMQLADKIMSHWRIAARSSSSKLQSPNKQQQQQQQSSSSPRMLVKSVSADVGLLLRGSTAAAASNMYHWYNATNAAAAAAAQSPPLPPSPLPPATAACHPLSSSCSPTTVASVTPVPVSCFCLGSFLFKGSSVAVEMVHFTPQVLSGRSHPAAAPGGKGVRVVQRVGVRDQITVMLPTAVEA